MNYCTMMRESAAYIKKNPKKIMTADSLGEVYSYTGDYFSYLFSAYYKKTLDQYLEEVREEQTVPTSLPERYMPDDEEITLEYRLIPEFAFAGNVVVCDGGYSHDPIRKVADNYNRYLCEQELQEADACLSLWWHDEFYRMQYLDGIVCEDPEHVPEDKTLVSFPAGEYAVFSMYDGGEKAEAMKTLVHYVYGRWIPENETSFNSLGYTFQCYKNGKVYYLVPVLEEERQEPKDKIYSVDSWTRYIDEHITMNLSTTVLAKKFSYSETHFKRVFRCYYKMSVADYIRKRRLQAAAERIRNGEQCKAVAARYNFKTYAGFSRAFQKEFNMTPAAYSASTFEVVDLARYYKEYKDSLTVTYHEIKCLKMIGQSVLKSQTDDSDLPAQVCYWLDKDFPCLENTRFSCNMERREDKVALWYQLPESENIEYILGPVVEDFDDDIPDEMIQVTLAEGKYAMFQTEKLSDKDNVAETLRMFFRCVHYGWVKEYRGRVDLTRITFERYIDNKIYLYVPIKY